jgi:hypothetical protein
MGTTERTEGTRTELSTFMADLGGIVRFDLNKFDPLSLGFVLNKALKLEKTPVSNPVVHNMSSILIPDSLQVFHYNLVANKSGNNLLTDTMVHISHKPLFSSRDFSKQSLGGASAFGLKFASQEFEPSLDLFDLIGMEKPAVRCDGEIVYSEVNAKNSILDIRAFDINLFGEREQEEASSLLINFQETFFDVPREVFFEAVRNNKRNLDSSFDGSNAEYVIFNGSTARKIVSHGTSVDDWFALSLFDHSTGLLDASDCELTLQPRLFEMRINKGVKFDVVTDFFFPCGINAELKSFGIDFESFDYFGGLDYLDFCSCSDVHNSIKEQDIFKSFGGWQFLPRMNSWVSLPHES